MLVHKTEKTYIDRLSTPNTNWLEDNAYYLVDSGSELAEKVRKYSPNFEMLTDEAGNLTDVTPCETPLVNIVEAKVNELYDTCTAVIYKGMNITLSDGETRKFTLTEKDQLNLSGIALKILMGTEVVAWHEDDETAPCSWYNKTDALTIIGTLTTYKEYHITYFRDLRIYVKSLTTAAEIEAVTYGFALPENAKSDVLKAYEQQLGAAL